MKSNIAPERYDHATLCFHWITALLVIEQWVGAHLIDDFAKGFPRVAAHSVPYYLRACSWRGSHRPDSLARNARPAAATANRGFLQVIAKGTHWLLYALLVTIVPVGMFLVWVQGDSYFDLFKVPAFAGATKVLRKRMFGEIHEWLGNTILIVAGMRSFAALFHHFVWRDNILRRMLPGRG